jgi:anti-anti-sigma regulatory factor
MATERIADNIIHVTLQAEPHLGEELQAVNEMLSENCNCDVIVDFAMIEMLTSASISNLLILHNCLTQGGHRLILCSVSFATKCIIKTSGLDTFFEFTRDKFEALKVLQPAETPDS